MSSVTAVTVLAAIAAGAAVLLWPAARPPVWTPGRGAWSTLRGAWGRRAGPASAGTGRGRTAGAARGLVPEALELVALALLGGGSLAGAVARVGGVLPGERGRELATVGARLHDGVPAEEAWQAAGAHWAPARRSLQLAEAAGVAPSQALVRSARDLRRDAVADVEVAAARLGVRLVVPLGLAYLPAFVLTTVLPVVLALTRGLTW